MCAYSVTVNSSVLITLILVLQYHDTILIIIFDYQGTCNFITIRGHHADSQNKKKSGWDIPPDPPRRLYFARYVPLLDEVICSYHSTFFSWGEPCVGLAFHAPCHSPPAPQTDSVPIFHPCNHTPHMSAGNLTPMKLHSRAFFPSPRGSQA